MEESISLEETNKIRVSLGLKPLVDDAGPDNDSDKIAEANYARQRDAESKQHESKNIVARIAKVRNRQELNTKLKGFTLGDADGLEDTLQWVKKAKKRERKLGKRTQGFENMDNVVQGEYTERDLVGLKFSHDFDKINEGDAKIFTLKDCRILDDEEDELQNIEMAEDDKKMSKDLKTKSRAYTGYDDDEFVAPGIRRSVLAKYDEDIDDIQETGFRLGGTVRGSVSSVVRAERESSTGVVNKTLLSINYAKNVETTDYLQEGDVGFKRPKTKKKRPSRQAQPEADPDDSVGSTIMVIDDKTIVPRARDLDSNFVDDEELQAALAQLRRAKIPKTTKLSPQEIAAKVAAERVRDEAEAAQEIVMVIDDETAGGLTFDHTTEFVRAIQYNPLEVISEPEGAAIKQHPQEMSVAPVEEMEEIEAGEVKVEDDEGAIEATSEVEHGSGDSENIGTSSQQHYSSSMASTLTLLRQQGILTTPTADQIEREQTQLQRDLWLAEQRRHLSQRQMEKVQGRRQDKDQATREYENRVREQQEARNNLGAFKNYKPPIDLTEYDEFGRAMTRKEAWKALSHKFHGKGSGKTKLEKRLKKIADEKTREAMLSGDTPLSMNKAFQQRQEKTGQAHFVLSIGNRSAIPQAAEYFDSQRIRKDKSKKLKKKSNPTSITSDVQEAVAFVTLPAAPQTATTSSDPNGNSSAPKPDFSRISISTVERSLTSKDGTPVPCDRMKVAFGFATKRKADGDLMETPPPKR